MKEKGKPQVNVLLSCIEGEKKDYDPFVIDHAIIYVLNGALIFSDGAEVTELKSGDIGFISKNQLLKTKKKSGGNRPFMSVTIFLTRDTLSQYGKEHTVLPKGYYTGKPTFVLNADIFLNSYFNSMIPYFENPEMLSENLTKLKTNEVIELLRREVSMENILFNFEENYKIDLPAFMNKNYMHNVPLEQFAKLTGRSLSTFKRDFVERLKETPSKWLIKKRLQLAHFLISNNQKSPTEVYFDTGFVNYAHFSKSFKSEFGINPSEL